MRAHLTVSVAQVVCPEGSHNGPGSLRDISAHGAFVYADFEPKVGAPISIDLILQGVLSDTRIKCEGTVVRVEKQRAGGQTGIAVVFTRFDMAA